MSNQDQAKWYDNKLVVYLLIILFFPVGLYALWKNNQISKPVKWVVTGVLAFFVIAVYNADPADATSNESTEVQEKQETKLSEAPKKPNELVLIKGNGDKKSKVFTISGDEVTMFYNFESDEDMGMLAVYVVPEGENVMETGGFPELTLQGSEKGETNLSHLSDGNYYLNIVSANGSWGLAVVEK